VRLTPFALLALFLLSCAAPAPAPVPPPVEAPPPASVDEAVTHDVKVKATALNVRREPSADAEQVVQVKKGTTLGVIREENGWVRVKLEDGTLGWVAERFVEAPGVQKTAASKKRKSGCPADSDFAFVTTPTLAFSDSGAHGLVVVDATVNTKGIVTAAKVVSNATADETLAFLAVKEIKSATFDPPIRACVPRSFIFTYRRMF
jgi:uncharacterized protein YgiM (DUF1202 family)